MKTIEPFNNTPTVVHVKELPPLNSPSFNFGFNVGGIGKIGEKGIPVLTVNVKLTVVGDNKEQIKISTYDSKYKLQGDGLILEDHIYSCCEQAIYAMKRFAQFDEIGRSIPQEIFQCPGKEAFEDDLSDLAKALNAIEGKRGFPPPK